MGYDKGRRRGKDKRDGFGEGGFDPFGGPPQDFGGQRGYGGDRFGGGGDRLGGGGGDRFGGTVAGMLRQRAGDHHGDSR